jgi:glycerate kinase
MFTRVMVQCTVVAGVVLGLLGLPGSSALPGPAQGAPTSTLRALDRQIDSMLARKKQQKKKHHCKKKHHKKKHHKKKKKSSKQASAAVNRGALRG